MIASILLQLLIIPTQLAIWNSILSNGFYVIYGSLRVLILGRNYHSLHVFSIINHKLYPHAEDPAMATCVDKQFAVAVLIVPKISKSPCLNQSTIDLSQTNINLYLRYRVPNTDPYVKESPTNLTKVSPNNKNPYIK